MAFQLQRRYFVLRLANQKHRLKPFAQWKLRTMENRAPTQTRLTPAGATLPVRELTFIKSAMGRAITMWANKALGPACGFQRRFALFPCSIVFKQLAQTHTGLKLYRVHRHDRAPLADPGDIMCLPVAHLVSLAEH